MVQSLWLTTLSISDPQSLWGGKVLKSLPAVGILKSKTFRGGKETGGWKGDRRDVDEVESWQQVCDNVTIRFAHFGYKNVE